MSPWNDPCDRCGHEARDHESGEGRCDAPIGVTGECDCAEFIDASDVLPLHPNQLDLFGGEAA